MESKNIVIRDSIRLASAICFSFLYIPHFLFYLRGKGVIESDLIRHRKQLSIRLPLFLVFLYLLHNNRYFRTLFYYRIGPGPALLISWWRPGDKSFSISCTTRIGKGCLVAHPYSTIINAESIGENFSCVYCTTIGETEKGRPVIGDNVSLGATTTIVGPVHIGDNVIIGAGTVVVKDIPNNCVAAGNPARIIKYMK